jgi:hypothetical protein
MPAFHDSYVVMLNAIAGLGRVVCMIPDTPNRSIHMVYQLWDLSYAQNHRTGGGAGAVVTQALHAMAWSGGTSNTWRSGDDGRAVAARSQVRF